MNKILSLLTVLATGLSFAATTTNEVGTVATQSDVATRLSKTDTNYGSGYIDWSSGSIYVKTGAGGVYYAYLSPGDIGAYMYDYNYGYDRTISLYDVNTGFGYLSSSVSSLESDVYYMQNDISSLYYSVYERPTYSEVETSIYSSIDATDSHFQEQVAAAAPINASNPTFKQQVNLATDATDVHFSNQVLAVGMHIDVHVIEEINELMRNGGFASNCWLVVDNYFQNNSVVKSVKKERTDKIGEFGTGWGYMLYDWTSDMRTWLLYVPELGVARTLTPLTTNKYVSLPNTGGTAKSATIVGAHIHPLLTDVFSYDAENLSIDLVRTDEKYVLGETNGCKSVTYDIGTVTMVKNPFFNVRVSGVDVTTAVYTLTPWLAVSNQAYIAVQTGDALYDSHTVPYAITNTITNIRTVTDGTTVTLVYDVASHAVFTSSYVQGGVQTADWTYSPTLSLTFSHTSGILVPVAVTKVRMATVGSSHYYWDETLHKTFEIKVSNGCMYAEIVSDENLTEKE